MKTRDSLLLILKSIHVYRFRSWLCWSHIVGYKYGMYLKMSCYHLLGFYIINISLYPPAYARPVFLDPQVFVPDYRHLLGWEYFVVISGSTSSPHWKVRWWGWCCFCICSAKPHNGSDWWHSHFWYHLWCRWWGLVWVAVGTANRWNGVKQNFISLPREAVI